MEGSPWMHDSGSGLGIQQPLAPIQINVLPPKRKYFSAAATGQDHEPDGGDRRGRSKPTRSACRRAAPRRRYSSSERKRLRLCSG